MISYFVFVLLQYKTLHKTFIEKPKRISVASSLYFCKVLKFYYFFSNIVFLLFAYRISLGPVIKSIFHWVYNYWPLLNKSEHSTKYFREIRGKELT